MTNSHTPHIKTRPKKCWKVGNNTVVVIDKSLVERLGVSEENTVFQEEIVEGGIFLRIIRQDAISE